MRTLKLFPLVLVFINFSFATVKNTELKSGFDSIEAKEMIHRY